MNRLLLTILFSFLAHLLSAQSLKDLQEQKKYADKEILLINEQLNATKKEKNSSIKQVKLIHSMIEKRKKIIQNIDRQITIVTGSIGVKTDTVIKLRRDIDTLKRQYGKTLLQAYKLQNSSSAISLVLASTDLQQAVKRMKYLKSYSDFRLEQASSIERKQAMLGVEIAELNQKKKSLENLLSQKSIEVKKLNQDEKTYQAMVEQFKSKEKELMKEIQKRKLLSDRLNREINFLIAEETRKAQEAARKKAAEEAAKNRQANSEKGSAAKSTPKITPKSITTELPFTPEDQIIAGKFENNRGRLPWPVRQGEIVEVFGEHMHPILKTVKIKNDGVDIASIAGSEVMAVFDGEVSKIFALPGANTTVLIRHGYYITVYSNLSKTTVKVGQAVKTKQVIGILAESEVGSEKPTLKFQIWKETTPQNPEPWLAR